MCGNFCLCYAGRYNVARSAEKMWVTSGLLLGDLFQARVNESHAWDMRHVSCSVELLAHVAHLR